MEEMQLLDFKPTPLWDFLVIHDNFVDCTALCWQYIIQVSALSALDGRVLAYHGFNG
jgi:hypothetical protein